MHWVVCKVFNCPLFCNSMFACSFVVAAAAAAFPNSLRSLAPIRALNKYIFLLFVHAAAGLECANVFGFCRENWMFIWMPFMFMCLRVNVWFFRFIFSRLLYCDCHRFFSSLLLLLLRLLLSQWQLLLRALSLGLCVCYLDINCCAYIVIQAFARKLR